jgi:hypothetical protein
VIADGIVAGKDTATEIAFDFETPVSGLFFCALTAFHCIGTQVHGGPTARAFISEVNGQSQASPHPNDIRSSGFLENVRSISFRLEVDAATRAVAMIMGPMETR